MVDMDTASDMSDAEGVVSPHRDPNAMALDAWEEYRQVNCPYIKGTADYTTTEQVDVETTDYLDHTFCGVMFNLTVKASLPVHFLELQEVWVRGELGEMTVWLCDDGFDHSNYDEKEHWTQVYEKKHTPSWTEFSSLKLPTPKRVKPGETVGIYVHSKARHDRAIVYDNSDNAETRASREDDYIEISTALAHLSWDPFGPYAPWGHSGWRQHREFVGKVVYGIRFQLFQPIAGVLPRFPKVFGECVRAMMLAAQRQELLLPYLSLSDEAIAVDQEIPQWPAGLRRQLEAWRRSKNGGAGFMQRALPLADINWDIMFYLFNFCRWDWFKTLAPGRPCLILSDAAELQELCDEYGGANCGRIAGSVCEVLRIYRRQEMAKVSFKDVPEWRTTILPIAALIPASPAEAAAAPGNAVQARRWQPLQEGVGADVEVEPALSEGDSDGSDEDDDDGYDVLRGFFGFSQHLPRRRQTGSKNLY